MIHYKEILSGWLHDVLGVSPIRQEQIFWSIIALLLFVTAQRIAGIAVRNRIKNLTHRYTVQKTLTYIFGFILILILLDIWTAGLKDLAAYLGILSAGIAIALKDPLTNLAGWLFIAVRKPFTVGDRVQIGDHAGDVIDQRMFQFSLVEIGNWVEADQSTGRIVHIPNACVFGQAVANFTQGFNFIWNEIPVVVTFESDWKKAKQLLTDIAGHHTALKSEHAAEQVRSAARKYLIFFEHLTPIVWTSVVDHGVCLTMRYLTEPRRRRSSESAIWTSVLEAFAKHDDIDFAYPTQRFYDNRQEGKSAVSATRPDSSGD